MCSEDANSGFFLVGAAPDTDALASTRANSTAIAKRMTLPPSGLSPPLGAGEEPRVAILWRMAHVPASAPSAGASLVAKGRERDHDQWSGVQCAKRFPSQLSQPQRQSSALRPLPLRRAP